MTPLLDPTIVDMLWTLTTAGALLTAAAATLAVLPWSDREIARVDSTFRTVGEITPDSIPLGTLS